MANANPPVSASVKNTSIQVLAANPSRTGLVIVNVSDAPVSITFGHPAVFNGGITLMPSDAFNMDAFLFTTQAVNAISSAANAALSIQEFQ